MSINIKLTSRIVKELFTGKLRQKNEEAIQKNERGRAGPKGKFNIIFIPILL